MIRADCPPLDSPRSNRPQFEKPCTPGNTRLRGQTRLRVHGKGDLLDFSVNYERMYSFTTGSITICRVTNKDIRPIQVGLTDLSKVRVCPTLSPSLVRAGMKAAIKTTVRTGQDPSQGVKRRGEGDDHRAKKLPRFNQSQFPTWSFPDCIDL